MYATSSRLLRIWRVVVYGAGAGPGRGTVPNFFKLPAGLYMGEAVGVATNSKGHVFVETRSGETRTFEFDQTGTFVKEFGVGSYGHSFGHAVRVDRYDNVWAVDEGSDRFSSARRTPLPSMRRASSTWPIAATPAFRCSTTI